MLYCVLEFGDAAVKVREEVQFACLLGAMFFAGEWDHAIRVVATSLASWPKVCRIASRSARDNRDCIPDLLPLGRGGGESSSSLHGGALHAAALGRTCSRR